MSNAEKLVGGLWLIFIGMFLRGAARASYYGVVVEQALGQTRVRDLMVGDPVVIRPDASVADAVEDYFLRHGYGGFPVGSDGRIEGMLSLSMVQHCPREERGSRRVREIMRPLDGLTIAPDASVAQALYRESESSRIARERTRALRVAERNGYRAPDTKPDKRARRLIRALGDIDAA